MRFNTISSKMLTVLLSVIILSMVVISFTSYHNSKQIIEEQITHNMDAELKSIMTDIEMKMQKVSTMTEQTARNVGTTYSTTKLKQYEEMLGKVIFDSDLVIGSGIWFEP
ncbi:hypothetical protein [Anaeromicropila herbilytica]|uniref:Methyl-accepting chemotaxis protein n=1 Tax=Anaeromicropila herbilytica TaxID=2785025 RepID=A0A7R7ELM8_9FIRM|nr:hypothetical protein [Anaeromicropila herbilytica]BCN31255.1 hypothetical protein bsdtb5_25500 [Anaeromicropila herbilytica]